MTVAEEPAETEIARPSATGAVSAENVRLYLDYLEKEMTIMGVLSAFCVAALSLALNQVLGAEKETAFHAIRDHGLPYMVLGSLFLLAGAWFFYRQRSLLAWFYGQIALAMAAPA